MIGLPNPFRRAVVPLSVEDLIDISFRRAFRKPRSVKKRGDKLLIYRDREISRIQVITDTITSRLDKVVKSFPSIERLDPFYRELLDIIAGVDEVKHSLGAVQWASKLISRISRGYVTRIKRTEDPDRMASLRREALGRITSILKRIKPEVDFLREKVPRLRDLPDIDMTIPTVIIAGMPNTGKSTLLSKLTTKTPEVAPYPFTTKGLIIGHREMKDVGRVQFIDTPGLLDRPLSKRNRIELQAVAALKHLRGIIIYLFDPTETCGYTLGEQISLFEDLRDNLAPNILVVVNKVDLERNYEGNFRRIREYLKKRGIASVEISAEEGTGLDFLLDTLLSAVSGGEDL
ncbi:MAG TPA: NOG1 family protein [Candidatus Korarchaeota archaeon]|nr:NOG1 family protein [Candidatus Korarchaeota archaeon]